MQSSLSQQANWMLSQLILPFLVKNCAVLVCRRNVAAKRCSDPPAHCSRVADAPTVRGARATRLGGVPDVSAHFLKRAAKVNTFFLGNILIFS